MKHIFAALSFVLLASTAQAQNWCGKDITVNTTLTQDQNCNGGPGIRIMSGVQLNLNHKTVSNASNACIRTAVGASNIRIWLGTVQNCGQEGIKLDTVSNGLVEQIQAFNNVREGIWCKGCNNTTIRYSNLSGNKRGVWMDGGGLITPNTVSVAATYNVIEGILFKGTWNSFITGSYLVGNGGGYDTVFDGARNNVGFNNGHLGHVRFRNRALNNNVNGGPYTTCSRDDTGSGSNSCS